MALVSEIGSDITMDIILATMVSSVLLVITTLYETGIIFLLVPLAVVAAGVTWWLCTRKERRFRQQSKARRMAHWREPERKDSRRGVWASLKSMRRLVMPCGRHTDRTWQTKSYETSADIFHDDIYHAAEGNSAKMMEFHSEKSQNKYVDDLDDLDDLAEADAAQEIERLLPGGDAAMVGNTLVTHCLGGDDHRAVCRNRGGHAVPERYHQLLAERDRVMGMNVSFMEMLSRLTKRERAYNVNEISIAEFVRTIDRYGEFAGGRQAMLQGRTEYTGNVMKFAQVLDVGSVSDGEVRDDDSDSDTFEHDLPSGNKSSRDINSNEYVFCEEFFLQDEGLSHLEMNTDYEAVNPSYNDLSPVTRNRFHEDLAEEPTASAEAAMRLMRRSTFNIVNPCTSSRAREVSAGQEPVAEHSADEHV
jgi:hypothetical protein